MDDTYFIDILTIDNKHSLVYHTYLWWWTITFLKRKYKGKPIKWITAKYLDPTEKRTWQWYVEHPTGNVALFDPSTTEIVIQRPHKFNQKYYTSEGRGLDERIVVKESNNPCLSAPFVKNFMLNMVTNVDIVTDD